MYTLPEGLLLLPEGPGPHPIAMLIHGGCWLATLGAMADYRPMAEQLASAGIATWNIEYRRVGHDGGGWPGTFSIRLLICQNPSTILAVSASMRRTNS